MNILEARDVRHHYGDSEILKGITLSIETGETVAVIGPSGAGKSTILRLLDLLESPYSGSISVGGELVNKSNRLSLRRKMSFVHQKPLVFSTSVFDNIAQPLRWRGADKQIIGERVTEALHLVNLDGFESRQAKTLSGGETQRVALARALVTDPEVMFLDEPTANLDPNSTTMVETLVADIIHRRNLTVVMATHDLSQGQRLADRIGVIMKGRLLQIGKSADIFMAPVSREVAEFIGIGNILTGTVSDNEDGLFTAEIEGRKLQGSGTFENGTRVNLFIRPEDITIATMENPCSSARNRVEGSISHLSIIGPLVRLEIDSGFKLLAVVTRQSAEDLKLAIGQMVCASFKATAIHAVKA
ncbi:tungstate transport system ATP-binding protein [Dehalogenimonas formicexedens]|uniref:Tungstate transport system ATP-binding protein n=1 Tax=Dehalogenimonas formicexedens TaxID=1839801 RepID=A0A1P8F878_9CHLR|nr:ABC transporter ATP-binding protein [Dehalogenimonas formicexedens]APV44655.1 tungstate transport system ATP-binding protein [Dehalogenimonas formicexedens]